MIFDTLVLIASILAGAVAAVSGFGIGSLLTPLLAVRYGTKLAVAVVSVPHLVGTAARFATMKQHVDRKVFWRFGIFSAAGGLAGAVLNARIQSPALSVVFGGLLIFAGISGVTGLAEKMNFGRTAAWVAGGTSGFFGGLVGNQGGIRSAALLGFDVSKEAFVATATAVALIVDGARMPVYFVNQTAGIMHAWVEIAIGIAGVLAGTFWGVRVLRRIPDHIFRRLVSGIVAALGIYMLARGLMG
jgi:uncharacterized membrane protein YfcA